MDLITSEEIKNIGLLIKANRIKAENDAKEILNLIEKFKKSMDEFDEMLVQKLGVKKNDRRKRRKQN